MWEALTKVYQSDNQIRKMVLKEKLRGTKMSRSNTMASYLTRITQVRDELVAVGLAVLEQEFVRTALNGFTKPWAPFVKDIVAREKLPNCERLWDDFIQEEIWEESLYGGQRKGDDDENLSLASHARTGKGKTKTNTSGEATSQNGKKKDMSKLKCFACHKFGHYAD